MAGTDPLYERLGGLAAVAQIVFAFYDRVLNSRRLAPYFADVDIPKLIDHQTKFLSAVMGGAPSYSNAQLREVHAHLNVTDEAFDEMLTLLQETLTAFGLNEDDSNLVISDLSARRECIVQASTQPTEH